MHYFLFLLGIFLLVSSAWGQSKSDEIITTISHHHAAVQDSIQDVSTTEKSFVNELYDKADSLKANVAPQIDKSIDTLNPLKTSKINEFVTDELKLQETPAVPDETVKLPSADLIDEPDIQKNLNPDEALNDLNLDKELLEDIKAGEAKFEKWYSESSELSGEGLNLKEAPEKIDAKAEEVAQEQEAVKELKAQEAQALSEQQKAMDQKKEMEAIAEKIRDKEKIKEEFRSKLNEQLAKSLVNHQQAIQNARKQVNKYKKNPYYKIGSVDKGNNAFKNKPLREKLSFGSNLQFNSWNPLSIDAAPQLTYLFHPMWRSGIGATYRFGLSMDKANSPAVNQSMHGYKTFIEWDGLHKIFLHSEYELLNEIEIQPDTEAVSHVWRHYVLSGIGRRFSYSTFFKGSALILYNFKYEHGSPYPSPWVFRIGAEFSPNFFNKKTK